MNTDGAGVVRTAWCTDEGGVADMIAAQAGADRDTGRDKSVPEMMNLTTGRFLETWEIVDAVAMLVSPRSASTTGAEFVVDSGFLKAV